MHHSNSGPPVQTYPVPTTLNPRSLEKGTLTRKQKSEMEKKLHEQVMKTIDETFGKEF